MSDRVKLGIGAILVVLCLFLFGRSERYRNQSVALDEVLTEKEADIQALKTWNGHLRYEKEEAVIDKQTAKEHYKAELDSIERWHQVKLKSMERALAIAQKTTGSGTVLVDTVTIYVDSDVTQPQGGLKFGVQEDFFTFDGLIDHSGSLRYSYTIFDSLSIVNHRKRVGLFRTPENVVSVYNKNPKTTITGITSLTIKEKPPRWVLGVGGGAGYGPGGLGGQIGVYVVKPLLVIR